MTDGQFTFSQGQSANRPKINGHVSRPITYQPRTAPSSNLLSDFKPAAKPKPVSKPISNVKAPVFKSVSAPLASPSSTQAGDASTNPPKKLLTRKKMTV